jgi:hypothetical protein
MGGGSGLSFQDDFVLTSREVWRFGFPWDGGMRGCLDCLDVLPVNGGAGWGGID